MPHQAFPLLPKEEEHENGKLQSLIPMKNTCCLKKQVQPPICLMDK